MTQNRHITYVLSWLLLTNENLLKLFRHFCLVFSAFIQKHFSCIYSSLGAEKTNSCKQHLVSKSSLCKNSLQPVAARVCYLKRVYCLAEVWEYIIKITLWHWSLTASIFWCNLSSCFSRPDICYGSAAQDEKAWAEFPNGAQRSYLAVIIFIRCRGENAASLLKKIFSMRSSLNLPSFSSYLWLHFSHLTHGHKIRGSRKYLAFFTEWSIATFFFFWSLFKKKEMYVFTFLNMEKKMCISVLRITVIIHTAPRWFPQDCLWLPVAFSRLLCIYGWKEPSFLGIDLVWSKARVAEVAE